MPAAGQNNLIGQTLAKRYHVNAKLGEGGMGSVYLANDLKLDCEVVIKTPHAAFIKDAEFAARFRREIHSLVQLSHPHIVKVMDVGVHEGLPFAVMQYLPGGSLEERQRPCEPSEILEWITDIADALDFMHKQGLIHRDVKPANILLDASGRACLGDFGIAKVIAMGDESAQKGLTGTGAVIGTGEFMAPEMLMPDLYSNDYDARVDQYALAVTVYDMLAGRPPFRGDTIATVAVKMARTKAPLLHEVVPSISETVSRVVARALLKKPDRRYPNCRDFAEAVSNAIRGEPSRITSFSGSVSTGSEQTLTADEPTPQKHRDIAAERTVKEDRPARRVTMLADAPVETNEIFKHHDNRHSEERRSDRPFVEWLKSPIGISWSVGAIVCLLLVIVAFRGIGDLEKPPTHDTSHNGVVDDNVTSHRSNVPGSGHQNELTQIPVAGDRVDVPTDEAVNTIASDWSNPTHLGSEINTAFIEEGPALSADGRTLVFSSSRPGGLGATDLWMCMKTGDDQKWQKPTNLGQRVNSETTDNWPGLSADGKTLIFSSTRSGGHGGLDLWVSTRESLDHSWSVPVNLGANVNSKDDDWCAAFTADGLLLVFASRRDGGLGMADLWMCKRRNVNSPWGRPVNLGEPVNSSNHDAGVAISDDGRQLLFSSDRPGGQGGYDIWKSDRPNLDAPWGAPVNLGPSINSRFSDATPTLTADGRTLIFASKRPAQLGQRDLWVSRRVRTVTRNENTDGTPSSPADGNRSVESPSIAIAPFDAGQAAEHQQAWADHFDTPTEVTNSIGMKFRLIPPGEFKMGWSQSEFDLYGRLRRKPADEDPYRQQQHDVRLSRPFYMGVHEVTRAQYSRRFSRSNDLEKAVSNRDPDRLPVQTVSWFDAVEFCNKLSIGEGLRPCYKRTGNVVEILDEDGYRLPTEAEWEYACRAGTQTLWSFGSDQQQAREFAWYYSKSDVKTRPVGTLKPNPFGLYDMHGNVREWCQDWFVREYYRISPLVDPRGPASGTHRTYRGGSCLNLATTAASFYRGALQPDTRKSYTGFRIARTYQSDKLKLTVPTPERVLVQPGSDGIPDSAVVSGNFAAWTVPADPKPKQNYHVVIEVRVGDGLTRLPRSDISGMIVGTDGYRQLLPGLKKGFLKVTKGRTQLRILVPAAANLVRDTITVRSKHLGESAKLVIKF